MKILLLERRYFPPSWHAWKAERNQSGIELTRVNAKEAQALGPSTPLWNISHLMEFIEGTLTLDKIAREA